MGHSFGGFVALHFAAAAPEMVQHLVLMDCAGVFPTLGRTGSYWGVVFKKSLLQTPRLLGAVGRWAAFAWFDHLRCGKAWYYWYLVLGHPGSWGDKAMAEYITMTWSTCVWNRPALAMLAGLNCPVTTIYGEDDNIMPAHQGDALQKLYGFPCEVIPGAGHTPTHGRDGQAVCRVLRHLSPPAGQPTNVNLKLLSHLHIFASTFSTAHTQRVIQCLYDHLSGHSAL